jgi:exodeoxyribonuclease VII small subunit
MSPKSLTYEQAIAELEQLLEDLQNQIIPVEAIATKSKRANELVEFCKMKLRSIEAEIKQQGEDIL